MRQPLPLAQRRFPIANHTGRHAVRDDAVRQPTGDDGAGADDRVAADIGHHDRGAADPRTGADPHLVFHARLLPDGDVEACDPVRIRTARHVDSRRQQHIALEMHPAEMTARSDVGVFVDARPGRREDGSELDHGRRRAVGDRVHQEGSAEVLSGEPRHAGPQLGGSLQRMVGPEHAASQCERRERRRNHGQSEQMHEPLDACPQRLAHGQALASAAGPGSELTSSV